MSASKNLSLTLFVGFSVFTLSSGPSFAASPQLDIEVSFLYWQATVDGLAFAVDKDVSQSSSLGKIYNPDFRWGPGLRLGLTYHLPHEGWHLALQSTLCRTHNTTEYTFTNSFAPVWVSSSDEAGISFTEACQHYRLHFGLIDALLLKQLSVTPYIDVSPYLALSFASIRQKYHLDYSSADPEDLTFWRMKNKFWGIGPSLGCSGQFSLCPHLFLFARASVGLLYGNFYTHQGEHFEKDHTKALCLFQRFFSTAPLATGSLGLRWQASASKEKNRYSGEIGFDQAVFFAQNQLPYFLQHSQSGLIRASQGDLSLMGVHASLGVSF